MNITIHKTMSTLNLAKSVTLTEAKVNKLFNNSLNSSLKKPVKEQSDKQTRKLHDRLLIEQTQRCRNEPIIDNQGNLHTFTNLYSHQSSLALVATQQNRLLKPQKCYICKQHYHELHDFYHRLCPTCADKNDKYRSQTTDLTGRVAMVTGGRIKIGFEIALKLLRAGAKVLVTTRFPLNAIQRYQAQPDFKIWQQRLTIFALDMKNIDSVEAFTHYINQHYTSLDILINNACQTLRKPDSYYQQMAEQEESLKSQRVINQKCSFLLSDFTDNKLQQSQLSHINLIKNKTSDIQRQNEPVKNDLTSMTSYATAPKDEFDEPIDLSPNNSWTKRLHEIDTLEFLEAQIINATAPFILNARLKLLLMASKFEHTFIVNVSAMEGQFNRENKTCKHPHTNMAKASLNMMTRTSAQDYVKDGIYMNSVDTGWVTQENPFHLRQKARLKGMIPPLDCIDGASRVLAPIFNGIINYERYSKAPEFGQFFKDYECIEW